jgi:hypothetical protein
MTLSLPLESPRSEPPAWRQVQKANPCLVALADRHYTRQKPGTPQFCRPGMNFALLLSDGSAGWVTWRPIPQLGRMDGLEAWECTFFRNEGSRTSSELVREATDLTYRAWGWPPRDGFITAVGIEQTSRRRSKKHPAGWCFICAGWRPVNERDGKAWLIAPPPERLRGASR